jgi:hypothetical protein
MRVLPPLLPLLLAALASPTPAAAQLFGATFGTGLAGFRICEAPVVVLAYNLSAGDTHAVLHHFWITGAPNKTDTAIVEYYVDGEAAPSVAFQPAFMCGLGFPLETGDHDYEYSAGGLCGKTAPVGGWSNVFPIPFYKSVHVTVRGAGAGCYNGYLNIRGTVGWPLALPGSGAPLPFGTRLVVQTNALALRQPLDFVTVAALPAGQRGLVFQTSWAVEAQPVGGPGVGGGYIEGCWNFYSATTIPYPGLVVGTGVEDYFDSGYYFGADSGDAVGVLFANALSGLTLFQRAAPFERLSAYRFHNTDPLVMVDGGMLTWQVGCEGHAGASKCGNPLPPGVAAAAAPPAPAAPALRRTLSPVNVTTQAFVYVFPPA